MSLGGGLLSYRQVGLVIAVCGARADGRVGGDAALIQKELGKLEIALLTGAFIESESARRRPRPDHQPERYTRL